MIPGFSWPMPLRWSLDSWNAVKAVEYREIMDLSDSWGTAVIVQSMVFGNKSSQSGSGVLFYCPSLSKGAAGGPVGGLCLWRPGGRISWQGLVTSYPISVEQAQLDGRSVEKSLEKSFPENLQ